MEISKLQPGQVLYSVERVGMGNTTRKTTAVYRVKVISIAEDGRSFEASWNGNPPRRYFRIPSRWKTKKPYIMRGKHMSPNRLATKQERLAGKITEYCDCFSVELP